MNEKKIYSLRLEDMLSVIEEKLKNGASVTFGPHGISMLPLIRQDKDSVVIEAVKEPLKKGDVIFYRRPDGQFVLHRIVGEDSRGYVLCGDNQIVKEYGVTDNHIIGIMTALVRDGKTVSCNDKRYLKYVSSLGRRRLKLKVIDVLRKIKHKIIK